MIVRPLIPQQSTVNGKRKVISRYEEGGEAKGIGGFFQKLLSDPTLIETSQAEQITPQTAEKIAKQSKAFVERSPVYLAGAAGDVLDLGMMGLSKLPSTGSFLQKDVKVDAQKEQEMRDKINPLPTSEEITKYLEKEKGVEFTDKKGEGDLLAQFVNPVGGVFGILKGVPKILKPILGIKPTYVVEQYGGELTDKMSRSATVFDPENAKTVNFPKNLSYQGFDGFSHVVVLDIDDALKFHPNRLKEGKRAKQTIENLKKEIYKDKRALDMPFISVRLVPDKMGNPTYTYVGQEGAHRLAALKQLMDEGKIKSRKVPMSINVSREGGKDIAKYSGISVDSSPFYEYMDEVGFSRLKSIPKVTRTEKLSESEDLITELDLRKGKVSQSKKVDRSNPLEEEIKEDAINTFFEGKKSILKNLENKYDKGDLKTNYVVDTQNMIEVANKYFDNAIKNAQTVDQLKKNLTLIKQNFFTDKQDLNKDLIKYYEDNFDFLKKFIKAQENYSTNDITAFASGGEVRGVGALSNIARNMFKQPRGVVTLSSVARNMFI